SRTRSGWAGGRSGMESRGGRTARQKLARLASRSPTTRTAAYTPSFTALMIAWVVYHPAPFERSSLRGRVRGVDAAFRARCPGGDRPRLRLGDVVRAGPPLPARGARCLPVRMLSVRPLDRPCRSEER